MEMADDPGIFRVVAINQDGNRVILANRLTRDAAERLVNGLQKAGVGFDYAIENDDTPHPGDR
jgi:hypothetical protein